METLLDFRESVKDFYGKYDAYIVSGWKFLTALLSFWFINGRLGYFEKLNSIFVVLILALFCSFLPINGIVLVGGIADFDTSLWLVPSCIHRRRGNPGNFPAGIF